MTHLTLIIISKEWLSLKDQKLTFYFEFLSFIFTLFQKFLQIVPTATSQHEMCVFLSFVVWAGARAPHRGRRRSSLLFLLRVCESDECVEVRAAR